MKNLQLFVRKGQFSAGQGRKKKETNRQSAEIQHNRPLLSLTQTAPFKKDGNQDRQQPGTETDCPFVSFMELFLQSTVFFIQNHGIFG